MATPPPKPLDVACADGHLIYSAGEAAPTVHETVAAGTRHAPVCQSQESRQRSQLSTMMPNRGKGMPLSWRISDAAAHGRSMGKVLKVNLINVFTKDTFMNEPKVGETAFRHGVSESDILHAYRNAFRWWQLDEGMEMHIGASSSGILLEIGVVVDAGTQRVVHAMPARSKFLPRKR